MVVPEDVIYYIADTITSNVRELEGSIKRVAAFSKLKNCEIDLALTKEAFKAELSATTILLMYPKL